MGGDRLGMGFEGDVENVGAGKGCCLDGEERLGDLGG